MSIVARLRRIAAVGGVESLGVIAGGVAGLLIVNLLPKDQYAQYTFLLTCMTLLLGVTDLGNHPQRHLVLHELIHGDHYDENGAEDSWNMLLKAAELKLDFPNQVHFMLANHDLAQIHGEGISKGGASVCEAFNKAVKRDFGSEYRKVESAITEFLLSFPLAVRNESNLFFSHSLPNENEIHEKYGTKNFLFTASSRAFDEVSGDKSIREFGATPEIIAMGAGYGKTNTRTSSKKATRNDAGGLDVDTNEEQGSQTDISGSLDVGVVGLEVGNTQVHKTNFGYSIAIDPKQDPDGKILAWLVTCKTEERYNAFITQFQPYLAANEKTLTIELEAAAMH